MADIATEQNITFMNVCIIFPFMLAKNIVYYLLNMIMNFSYCCKDYLIKPLIHLITFLPELLINNMPNYVGTDLSYFYQTVLILIKVMTYVTVYYCIYRIYKFILTRIFLIIFFAKFNVFYSSKYEDDYHKYARKLGNNYKPFVITKKNGKRVFGFLYNKNKAPQFTDDLILYSFGFTSYDYHFTFWGGYKPYHGHFNWKSIIEKSNKTIVVYDYSCAGMNNGFLTEESMYDDIEQVWRYLILNEADPQKIIVYGRCIGGAVASHLVKKIVSDSLDKRNYPAKLILESIFVNTTDLIYLYCCIFGFILPIDYEFNTHKHLKFIDKSVYTVVAYSNYNQRVIYDKTDFDIIKENVSSFVEIEGDHCNPRFTWKFIDEINKPNKIEELEELEELQEMDEIVDK